MQRHKARVVAAFGRHCVVELVGGVRLNAQPRGKKFGLVCGDEVEVSIHGDEGAVESLKPRRNSLFRQDEMRTKVFAANLDQIIFVIAAEPVFSDALLGRALLAAHVAGLPIVIALNKIDLPAASAARERLTYYSGLGYCVVEISAKHNDCQALRSVLSAKCSLILGGSGVGKSTLINALCPAEKIATQAISSALNSGKHTTTTTIEYALDESYCGARMMDSPGFQSFGLQHLSPSQVEQGFVEIQRRESPCKFYNCTHLHEPACTVREAVASGSMAPLRYALYQQVLQEVSAPKY